MLPFPVVACVSSAGGLDALTRVVSKLPGDFPAAIIALQHAQPDRPSHLAEILSQRCALPVHDAADYEPLVVARVYVAPAGRHTLVAEDGRLRLVVSGEYPPYRPSADLLLTSVALAAGPRAIAVVLSGGGNDGATGATVVHDFGGTVITADAASSAHYGMPAATVGRDDAMDYQLGVDAIGDMLIALVTATV